MNVTPENCSSILVVEDDFDIRETLVESLEMEGYVVSSAANGQEALTILSGIDKPCLVLLDMMMPVMDGRQFLDHVKTNKTLGPLSIFVVSAIADKSNTEGSIGFIRKPIDLDVVLKIVDQYCGENKH